MGTRDFRKKPDEKVWHLCNNCANWPTYGNYDIEYNEPPEAEYCPECRAKSKDGSCSSGQVA